MRKSLFLSLVIVAIPIASVAGEHPIFRAINQLGADAVLAILEEDPEAVRARDEEGSQPLHAAVRLGRKDIVELLLRNGADLNAQNDFGRIPLGLALGHSEQIAELLLQRGANVHFGENSGVRLLESASSWGYIEVTRLLLAGKAHVKDDKVQADSSLLLAADHGHLEVVKLLVAAGADVNHQTGFEPDFIGGMDRKHNGMQTSLLVAASGGHVETVEALLKWKANPNVRDQFGLSPLDHAARIGSLPIAELLIAHKARIAWPAADEPRRYPLLEFHRPIGFPGTTSLHWAAEGGHDKVVALLLENGADPHSLDVHKRTPLHRLLDDVDYSYVAGLRFVTLGMQQIIEPKNAVKLEQGRRDRALVHLLNHKADVNAQDGFYHTPLFYAQKHAGRSELPNLLVTAGARLSFVDAIELQHVLRLESLLDKTPELAIQSIDDHTPLHRAAASGATRSATLLLEHGAKVNERDHQKRTPLHAAANLGQAEMVRLLLDNGASINAVDTKAQTALDLAVIARQKEAVTAMLTRRADLEDEHLLAALRHAVFRADSVQHNYKLIDTLLRHRGDSRLDNDLGTELLARACHLDYAPTVYLLLRYGAAVNGSKNVQLAPLEAAARRGHLNVVKVLLDYKADINARNPTTGRTALHAAVQADNLPIVQLLLRRKAEVNAVDNHGTTPLALVWGNSQIAELLRQSGGRE